MIDLDRLTEQNRLRINEALRTLSDLLNFSSSDPSVAFEFDHWAESIFEDITGYGQDVVTDDIPEVFLEAWGE